MKRMIVAGDWLDDMLMGGKKFRVVVDADGDHSAIKTDDPKRAIETWFKYGAKHPFDSAIYVHSKEDALELRRYARNNPDWFTELYNSYKCPYKLESLQEGVNSDNISQSFKFVDTVYPFCYG